MNESVLTAYGFQPKQVSLERIGTGLINHTWKVFMEEQAFILQKINEDVFSSPDDIAFNLDLIAAYLRENHPDYHFVAPVNSQHGNPIVYKEGEGYFRLFPFVNGSHSKATVTAACEAYEAAKQFGKFTRLLSGFEASKLRITIPHFHDLEYRYREFTAALSKGSSARIRESRELAHLLLSKSNIADRFGKIKTDPAFHVRVTHHDTKISNVLFDASGKGICVIDLDTLMPGYFISDLGDMMRTYLSPVSEEDGNADNIEVRDDFYQAIVEGYLDEMKDELTESEKKAFFYSGVFMTYMQALRFLTDYLRNDPYYIPSYEGHNLVRARNQCVLLQRMLEKEKMLS